MNIAVKAFLRGLVRAEATLELEVEPGFYHMLRVQVPSAYLHPYSQYDERTTMVIFGHAVRCKRYSNGSKGDEGSS